MHMGYEKDELIVKVSVDKESLIGKLLDISDKASELSATARSLVHDLQEDTGKEG